MVCDLFLALSLTEAPRIPKHDSCMALEGRAFSKDLLTCNRASGARVVVRLSLAPNTALGKYEQQLCNVRGKLKLNWVISKGRAEKFVYQ